MDSWQFRKVLTLRGPNRWGLEPATEAWLTSSGAECFEVAGAVRARATDLARVLAEDPAASSGPTDLAQLPHRCSPGHLVARVAAALQIALGEPRPRWQVVSLPMDAVEAVVVTFAQEEIGRACLDEALGLCRWLASGEPRDVDACWRDLRAHASRRRTHPLWRALARAAASRDVPRLATPAEGVCQIGWGVRQQRLAIDRLGDAEIDATATRALLQSVGASVLDPDQATADEIASAVLDAYCRRHGNGRIPVICVTGTNGKTTTARLCADLLTHAGHRVGLTCTDGIYLHGRCVDSDDCSGPRSARRVLLDPTIDAAVLETARGGILREGVGVDRCDVAIVTNIGAGDHLGLGGVHTVEQIAEVKRTIVTAVGPRGTAVLNANDPLTVAMASHCPGAVIFFASEGRHPVIRDHRARGGRAVYVTDGAVVLAEASREVVVAALAEIPVTWGGRLGFQVENVLAAIAAAWALDLPRAALRATLTTFQSSFDRAPAGLNVFDGGGATVVVDYGHNTSSLRAMLPTLRHFSANRRVGVFTAAGDRRDVDMVEMGRLLGDAFDEIVIFADRSVRGRDPLQIAALIGQGVRGGRRARVVRVEPSFCRAAQQVLDAARPGDLVVLQADDVNQTVEYLRELLATGQLRASNTADIATPAIALRLADTGNACG